MSNVLVKLKHHLLNSGNYYVDSDVDGDLDSHHSTLTVENIASVVMMTLKKRSSKHGADT